jgi:RNA polymerase sigma-70 factor (ECF subfamily)
VDDQSHDPERLRWERQVLERAREGDAVAFSELYRAYAPEVYRRILLPRLGDPSAAEDALAETFRAAFERLATFEQRDKSIRSWLSRIAVNKVTDMYRARAVSGRALSNFEAMLGPLVEPMIAPEDALAERRDVEWVRGAIQEVLDRITPRYRAAIELRFFEEKSRQECAESLDVKLGTFDVLLLRALRAFRKEWDVLAARTEPADGG